METEISILKVFTSFGIGFMTFISPCVLPIIPSYLVYISGVSFDELTGEQKSESKNVLRTTFLNSLMFVLGFILIFTLLGATATFIGKFLTSHLDLVLKVAGAVVIFFGLHLSGIIKLNFLMQEHRLEVKDKPRGLLGSFLVGLAFGAGWTPCVGPFLGTALTMASTESTLWSGVLLLATFGLGMGIPFLVASLAFNSFLKYTSGLRKYMDKFTVAGGIFLIIMGVSMITGWFARLSLWLTSILPVVSH